MQSGHESRHIVLVKKIKKILCKRLSGCGSNIGTPNGLPWQMDTWTKTCGPYPCGLIFSHTHLSVSARPPGFSLRGHSPTRDDAGRHRLSGGEAQSHRGQRGPLAGVGGKPPGSCSKSWSAQNQKVRWTVLRGGVPNTFLRSLSSHFLPGFDSDS